MIRLPRKLFVWGGAAVIAASGFAFMASNSVGASYAGEGSNSVSGYTVSHVVYSGVTTTGGGQIGTMQWNNTGAVSNGLTGDGVITTVSFTVSPDNALWSEVQLYDSSRNVIAGGGASNCTESAGVWTCNLSGSTGYDGGAPWSNNTSGASVSQLAFIDVEAVH